MTEGAGRLPTPAMPRGGERFGAWFDHAAAAAAVAFFPNYLRHIEGEWYGQPFELAPWQRDDFVRKVYGWKRADGTRLIRIVYIEVPRKNGKTTLLAGVSLLALLGDGEFGGQGYAMAVDEDQARILFGKAGVMAALSEDLKAELDVYKTAIHCPALNASFKPLSKGVINKHGLHPSFAVGDEVHEWPDGEQADVVHKGMAGRQQPLEIYITTAGQKNVGYGWELHDYALKVLAGSVEDPTFLPVIYAAGEDDDWTDEAVWRKANPNIAYGSPKIEFLRAECERARQSPRLENNFRRFHLNQWTEQVTRWLPMASWQRNTATPGQPCWAELDARMLGRECWSGIDLSSTRDLACLIHVFPPEEEGERTTVVCRFWLPRLTYEQRIAGRPVPFDVWAREGALTVTDGNVVDYAVIEAQVLADAERYRIRKLAIDPWNATGTATRLAEEGAPIEFFRQGYGSMSSPSKHLERLVLAEELEHGGHPVLTWNASNVTVREDPAGNIKPDKERSGEKIDGIVGLVEAIGVMDAANDDDDKPIAVTYRRGDMYGGAAA